MVQGKDPETPVPQAATRPIAEEAGPDVGRIFREQASRVLAAAYRVTGSAEDAEDVLQTVFTRLVRRDVASRLGNDPGAYLHRSAVNAALDVVRSRRAARASSLDDAARGLAAPETGQADRRLTSVEIRDAVRGALSTLSPRSAEIFVLRYFEGYDNHEIARMVGSSRSTIGVVLHRARERVREAIDPSLGGRP
jgi:RNA polymerase sigma-70 factor (ECF subfamily)